jgi:phosphoglycolate phosphatase-like HAD superfamily hydrolase
MRRLGLERFFAEGQGGFGCDAEERDELIAVARERAGGWPAARTVEIGDTARDVETARAAGIRSIAVRSPPDLAAVADLLLAWNG